MNPCIHIGQWLAAGFIATVCFTVLDSVGQALRLTRMSMPYLIGSVFTPSRDRARALGIALHLVLGQFMALLYFALFDAIGSGTALVGALLGALHGTLMVVALIPAMPAVHPRMASDEHGPTATRQLEPPGRLALNYGIGTPVSIFVAHVAFGAILGFLYRAPPGC